MASAGGDGGSGWSHDEKTALLDILQERVASQEVTTSADLINELRVKRYEKSDSQLRNLLKASSKLKDGAEHRAAWKRCKKSVGGRSGRDGDGGVGNNEDAFAWMGPWVAEEMAKQSHVSPSPATSISSDSSRGGTISQVNLIQALEGSNAGFDFDVQLYGRRWTRLRPALLHHHRHLPRNDRNRPTSLPAGAGAAAAAAAAVAAAVAAVAGAGARA